MSRDVMTLARNFLLSLGGEGLQSGFHFGLNLLLVRLLAPYDYGVFAIVFVLGGIALTYGNALVSIPASIHIAGAKSARTANFYDVAFGSAALAISALAGLIVAVGLWLTIRSHGEALAGGLFVALWTLRNHLRNTLFARQAMAAATVADVCYAVTGIALTAGLMWLGAGGLQATTVLLVLAAANAAGIAVALIVSRQKIRLSFARSVRRRYRAVWSDVGWSLVWVTTWNIQGQGLTFLVAAIAGPAAYAPIAAGILLFGPLRTALGALVNVIRPSFSSALAERHHRRVLLTLFGSLVLVVLGCVAFGACIWLAWPFLAVHIYGEKFADAAMPLIVTLAWITTLAYASYHVPLALVQAGREFRAVAVSTIIGAILGLSLVTLLLNVSTVAWSLAGALAGEVAALVLIWIAAMRVLTKSDTTAYMPNRAASV